MHLEYMRYTMHPDNCVCFTINIFIVLVCNVPDVIFYQLLLELQINNSFIIVINSNAKLFNDRCTNSVNKLFEVILYEVTF